MQSKWLIASVLLALTSAPAFARTCLCYGWYGKYDNECYMDANCKSTVQRRENAKSCSAAPRDYSLLVCYKKSGGVFGIYALGGSCASAGGVDGIRPSFDKKKGRWAGLGGTSFACVWEDELSKATNAGLSDKDALVSAPADPAPRSLEKSPRGGDTHL